MGRFNWNGDRTGQVVIATEPFYDTGSPMGHCYVDKDEIQLPSGIILTGVLGDHINRYVTAGSLLVAVGHSGDYFNDYVPVTVSERREGLVMTPFTDLTFGAYGFGKTIHSLVEDDVERIRQGTPIPYELPQLATAVN